MKSHTWLFKVILVILLISLSTSGTTLAQDELPPQAASPDTNPDISPGRLNIPGADSISYHSETGLVRFIGTLPDQQIARAATLTADATPEQSARSFLDSYGQYFGLQLPNEELQLMRIRDTENGQTAVRFQQVYQGVPIIAGELIVGLDSKGNVLYTTGEVLPNLSINITPSIGAEHAQFLALEVIAKEYDLSIDQLAVSEPELWVYNPALLGTPGVQINSLVWRMTVKPIDLLPFDQFVLVDAQQPSILLHFNQVDTVRYRAIYDNNNNSALGLPGYGPVRIEGGSASSVTDVNNAYDYSGDTYDFYFSRHGRDSIDDASMVLVSTVRYCPSGGSCPYPNAFWNGEQMVFGAGYASADDVVAHELTHGVTQNESGLFYYMQSGAVNEAFSDVWGEFVDLVNGRGNDTAGVRWLIGEDLPGGAIRSMSNPPAYNQPDRMGSTKFYCGTADNGGVHYNSGVGNKAAYLMVDGGTFNGYTISGIGIDKTARIWYNVQTQLLTSGSDYQDLHDALAQSCNNLVGTAGITVSDCETVRRAISATEMNRQPTLCAASHAPLCDQYGFDSQFNGTAPGWVAYNSTWYISSTYLYTEGTPNTSASAAHIEKFSDLDYSVRMRRFGCSTCSNRIIIRGSPFPLDSNNHWFNYYLFQYTKDGSYSVYKQVEGGGSFFLRSWTFSPAINTGDAWNTLRVVVEGSNLFFFINGDLVWSGRDDSLTFGQAGIGMYRDASSAGNKLEVDWATLSGGTPINIFFDNMENGPSKWISGTNVGNDEWYHTTGYATSGEYMLYGWNQPSIADYFIRMASPAPLPAGKSAFLHFNHAYDFEAAYDGGVLEYSANNGPWIDAEPLITENGYKGTLSSSFGNPLGGRSAYVGESYGYYSTRLNLSSLAGKNIRFRFRIGTDSSVSNPGWFIDDVRIYTCALQPHHTYLPLMLKDFTPSAYVPGFNSQFNGSADNWEVHTGVWTVGSAYYSSAGLMNLSASASYQESFSNLDYRVRMRRFGCTTCSNRILIRGTPAPLGAENRWYSYLMFQYSADGMYSIWKRVEGGSATAVKNWTTSSAINTGNAWNTLRVVANGSNYTFYINGTQVWSGSDPSFSTGRVGIGLYGEGPLDVDWAVLTLPSTSSLENSGLILSAPSDFVNQFDGDENTSPDP